MAKIKAGAKPKPKPFKIPAKADLVAVLNAVSEDKRSAREITGEIGPRIDKFSKANGQNSKAVAFLAKLHDMSEKKRSDYLRTLIPGILLLEEDWNAGTGDLFEGVPTLRDAPEKRADGDLSDEEFAAPVH